MLIPNATPEQWLKTLPEEHKDDFLSLMNTGQDRLGGQGFGKKPIDTAKDQVNRAMVATYEWARKIEISHEKIKELLHQLFCSDKSEYSAAREELKNIVNLRNYIQCLASVAASKFGIAAALIAPILTGILMWIAQVGIDKFCASQS